MHHDLQSQDMRMLNNQIQAEMDPDSEDGKGIVHWMKKKDPTKDPNFKIIFNVQKFERPSPMKVVASCDKA